MTTKGQNFQDVQEGVLPSIGADERTNNQILLQQIDQHINGPLRIGQSQPLADANLVIAPNEIESGDGAGRSSLPSEDVIGTYPLTTINFQTGVVTGGNVTTEGSAFSIPTTTVGHFRKVALVYKSETNTVDTVFSVSDPVFNNLPDAGFLFGQIDGIPLGFLDLEATGANAFKTRGSATNVVENNNGTDFTVHRFGGATRPAIVDTSFRIQSITNNVAKLKRGFIDFVGQQLVSSNGVEPLTDIFVDLKTQTNTNGVNTPAPNSKYYLYIDSAFLPTETVPAGPEQRESIEVAVSSDAFIVLPTPPENIDRDRYIHLSALLTDGAGDYVAGEDLARRVHVSSPVAVNPTFELFSQRSIGDVGAKIGPKGPLELTDFDPIQDTIWWPLNDGVNNEGTIVSPLVPINDQPYIGKGFFGRENIYQAIGTNYLISNDPIFDNSLPWSFGGWFKLTSHIGNLTLASNADAGFVAVKWYLQFDTFSGELSFRYSSTGSGVTNSITIFDNFDMRNEWHHITLTTNGAFLLAYFDGALVRTATLTGGMFSGGGENFNLFAVYPGSGGYMTGFAQDVFWGSNYQLSEDQIAQIYARRFTATPQIAAGHTLTDDSFPCELLGVGAYFPLEGDLLDKSPNGLSLNNSGGNFTARDIKGNPNNAMRLVDFDNLNSSDPFFNKGDSESFTVAGWWRSDNWTSSLPTNYALSGDASVDRSWQIVSGGGVIQFLCSATPSGIETVINVNTSEFKIKPGGWYHLALVYDTNERDTNGDFAIRVYINGMLAAADSGFIRKTTTASLLLQSGGSVQNDAAQFAYIQRALDNNDVRKLYGTRFDLASALNVKNQEWDATYFRQDGRLTDALIDGWIVDKKAEALYADLGGGPNDDLIELRLSDLSSAGRVNQVQLFDRTYTTAPPAIVPHGIGQLPTDFVVLWNELGDGRLLPLSAEDYLKADDTNLYLNFGSITVSPTQELRIIARTSQKTVGSTESFGFTKFVNAPFSYLENYATLNDALAVAVPGDHILVMGGYNTTDATDVTVDDIKITFMPNVEINYQGAAGAFIFQVNAQRVQVWSPRVRHNAAVSMTTGYSFGPLCEDCELHAGRLEVNDPGGTVVDGFSVDGARGYVKASAVNISGTLSNLLADIGVNNDILIRG